MTSTALSGIAVLLVAAILAGCQSMTPVMAEQRLVVYLVRHAEKVDAGADPELSGAGRLRARVLANTLRLDGIEAIHSSDFVRTRDTAAPVAAAYGLEVEIYDARDLPGLVAHLRQRGGRHLVVGHSNTTPALVSLLGGDPGAPIDEAREYDRLYVVSVSQDGSTKTELRRYGKPYGSIGRSRPRSRATSIARL